MNHGSSANESPNDPDEYAAEQDEIHCDRLPRHKVIGGSPKITSLSVSTSLSFLWYLSKGRLCSLPWVVAIACHTIFHLHSMYCFENGPQCRSTLRQKSPGMDAFDIRSMCPTHGFWPLPCPVDFWPCSVKKNLPRSHPVVTKLSQSCRTVVVNLLQNCCLKIVPKLLQSCLKVALNLSQSYLPVVLRGGQVLSI